MKKYILLLTTDERENSLLNLISTMNQYLNDEWSVLLVCQGHSEQQLDTIKQALKLDHEIVWNKEWLGMMRARILGLKHLLKTEGDFVVVLVDDDMLLTDNTNYEPMVEFALQPNIGFVASQWSITKNELKVKKLQHKFIKRALILTGGGLACKREVVECVCSYNTDEDTHYDNLVFALRAYTNGYDNYMYLGSVALHKVGGAGGRREWITGNSIEEKYNTKLVTKITTTPFMEKFSLTDKSIKLHKQNAKLKGFI